MRRIAICASFAAALVLGGCASKPADGSGAKTATTESTPRVSTPVNIPIASAKTVVLSMTGAKQVTEAKDWADFKKEWRDTFSDYAKSSGIAFSFVDGVAAPTGQDGTLLLVDVADYRIVGIAARIMFGIMTGNAFIDATIKFASLRDGTVFGEQQYNTSSSVGGGVFSKVTPQQVDLIGSEVFRDLKAAR